MQDKKEAEILKNTLPKGSVKDKENTITDNYCSKAQYREKLHDWIQIAERLGDEDLKKEVQTMLEHEEC